MNFDAITSVASVIAALGAMAAAWLSYIQARSYKQADVIPNIQFHPRTLGIMEVQLRLSNVGDLATKVEVRYTQASGPEAIELSSFRFVFLNQIDMILRGEPQTFTIGRVSDYLYFQDRRQHLAHIIPEAADAAENQLPIVLRVDIRWSDRGHFRRQERHFSLIIDSNVYERNRIYIPREKIIQPSPPQSREMIVENVYVEQVHKIGPVDNLVIRIMNWIRRRR
jgi:hypothetical protein